MEAAAGVTVRWLSSKRFRQSEETRTLLQDASSDRGRVVFCASFRRLNQKMQVFALDPDDSVRTRLTHSLEVAHIGIYIVDEIFRLIDQGEKSTDPWNNLQPEQRLAIRTFVETACLVHDIGNPPFGHFGEKAIRSWFGRYTPRLRMLLGASNHPFLDDFVRFDGNKQGFRILTRLQRNVNDQHGLNLTFSQLAATIKYPLNKTNGKGSVFETERSLKDQIWSDLDMPNDKRHPLVFPMEAADDIAYCVSDIEDAESKGLIKTKDFDKVFSEESQCADQSRKLTKGRTRITRKLVTEAAAAFLKILSENDWGVKHLLEGNPT